MKIYLHEIKEQETELDFTQEDSWAVQAVERVDETFDSGAPLPRVGKAPKPAARPLSVHFSLRKVDEVVVISGNVSTYINLVCSRCANPFQLNTHPSFSGLFCKDPVMAGVGHLQKEGKPAGQNKGFARHAHDSGQDDLIEEGKDLDITYLSQDYVDLSEVLTEQLQLQVPFQPLCDDDCKGMCSNCGADLNVGRCACAKVAKQNPFSVLRDLKL